MAAFVGEPGRKIWDRVGHLVPRFENEYLDQAGMPRPEHFLDIVEFIIIASFGSIFNSSSRFGTLSERLKWRHEWNNRMYRLSVSDRPAPPIPVKFDAIDTQINTGCVRGFMAITPITHDGHRKYVRDRSVRFDDLGDGEIARSDAPMADYGAVIMNALIHIRSIGGQLALLDDLIANPGIYRGKAMSTLTDYMAFLGEFIPRLDVTSYDPPQIETDIGLLPVIICPTSGRGMGAIEVKGAGFEEAGCDLSENTLWTFDSADINRSAVPIERRERMLETVETLLYYQFQ